MKLTITHAGRQWRALVPVTYTEAERAALEARINALLPVADDPETAIRAALDAEWRRVRATEEEGA